MAKIRRADWAGADNGGTARRAHGAGPRGARGMRSRRRHDLRQPQAICRRTRISAPTPGARPPTSTCCAAAQVDLAFVPAADEIYPPGFATLVQVSGLTEGLCGAHRAGHFDGVATVVTKLLLQSLPDAAYFGEKDYQQLMVIRRLARDLDIPVRIEGVATWREPDGLALSSRNIYLSPEERRIAPALARVLRRVAVAVAQTAGCGGARIGARRRRAAGGRLRRRISRNPRCRNFGADHARSHRPSPRIRRRAPRPDTADRQYGDRGDWPGWLISLSPTVARWRCAHLRRVPRAWPTPPRGRPRCRQRRKWQSRNRPRR